MVQLGGIRGSAKRVRRGSAHADHRSRRARRLGTASAGMPRTASFRLRLRRSQPVAASALAEKPQLIGAATFVGSYGSVTARQFPTRTLLVELPAASKCRVVAHSRAY
jgi:hypothetical protein